MPWWSWLDSSALSLRQQCSCILQLSPGLPPSGTGRCGMGAGLDKHRHVACCLGEVEWGRRGRAPCRKGAREGEEEWVGVWADPPAAVDGCVLALMPEPRAPWAMVLRGGVGACMRVHGRCWCRPWRALYMDSAIGVFCVEC